MASVKTMAGVTRGDVMGDLGQAMSGERRGPMEADLRGLGPASRKLNAGERADSTEGPGWVWTGMGIWRGAKEVRLDLADGVEGPAVFTGIADPPACGVPASVLPVVVVVVDLVGEAILPSDTLACKGKQMAPLGNVVMEAVDARAICHGWGA